MKLITALIAVLAMAILTMPSFSLAAGETATANYKVKGSFIAKKYRAARLSWGVNISTEDNIIMPMKRAQLRFPPARIMKFSPPSGLLPCTDISADRNPAVPPEQAYILCGRSVLGNGTATFALGRNNTSAPLPGTIVVLYGGKVGNGVKLKFSAWSNETNAGVYTEGIWRPDGTMNIAMPVLTADSSVTSLNLNVPGRTLTGSWASGGTYTLRPGVAKKIVQVKCRPGRSLLFNAFLTLGARNPLTHEDIGENTYLNTSGRSACTR